MNAYQKTEAVLYDYSSYKLGVELSKKYNVEKHELSAACIANVDEAIKSLKNEKYICIVKMYYFDRLTLEQIAEELDISWQAVSVQKKKLINKLKTILFSDDAIRELLTS